TFACCPPGPEERLVRSWISASGIASEAFTRSASGAGAGASAACIPGVDGPRSRSGGALPHAGVAPDVAGLAADAHVDGVLGADVSQPAHGRRVDAGEGARGQAPARAVAKFD